MSVYSFSREGSTFSVCGTTRPSMLGPALPSIFGTTKSSTTATESLPEDPVITKSRKQLYGISARKAQKPPEDSQLVMYDPEVIHFPQWRSRFDKLLEVREIEDEETKKSILLKALLPKTVDLIPTLFRRHEEPFEKDTNVILDKLQNYYDKIERKDRIKSRIRFFNSVQGGAHFYEFANTLKAQLFDCDFGSFEQDALVTAFVMGLDNPILKKHLLEKELWCSSLIETVELALKFQEVLPQFSVNSSESVCEVPNQSSSCSDAKGAVYEIPNQSCSYAKSEVYEIPYRSSSCFKSTY
ncbi:hypothetical protein GE061_013200 [Apolygus lucorum]|uniref:Uncharacterized protein n=1 Tax=Apolygus lucorum TaxID=248454 RepID=A0A8S9XVR1_APOLU|nr:hypothetical protein GE061_013200 [Apolygus lucorum]